MISLLHEHILEHEHQRKNIQAVSPLKAFRNQAECLLKKRKYDGHDSSTRKIKRLHQVVVDERQRMEIALMAVLEIEK